MADILNKNNNRKSLKILCECCGVVVASPFSSSAACCCCVVVLNQSMIHSALCDQCDNRIVGVRFKVCIILPLFHINIF